MHDHIIELKELFMKQNISSVNKGIEALNHFFSQFEFHILKEEWSNMNRDERRAFVKTLLSKTENSDNNETEIDSETIQSEVGSETTETEIAFKIEDVSDETICNEQTELQKMIDHDIQFYIEYRQEVLQKLAEVNQKLKELGHNNQSTGTSKTDVCRNWIKQNPTCTRSEFMENFKELGSKAMLSTYWQKLKTKN